MVTPTSVHHIGVVVRSMDEALAFFRDALGLPLLAEEVVQDQGVRAALLDLGNGFLELLEPTVPDTGIARYLDRRGEGLHHVCLEVPDIDAALAGLKQDNVALVDETPRRGLTGTIAFLHPSALHGVLVELVHGPTAFRRPVPDPWPLAHDPGGATRGAAPIQRLDHIILAVQQLQEAAADWARVLGLQAQTPHHPEGSHLQLARLPLSDSDAGGPFLELVAVGGGPGRSDSERPALSESEGPHRSEKRGPEGSERPHRLARFIADRGEGMFSISLEVDDLDTAVAELRAKDIPVSDPEPGSWPGTRLARVPRASAHGVAVQMIERAP